jgi:Ras-related GTP-binding protein C/D
LSLFSGQWLTEFRYLCLVSVIRNRESKEKRGLIDLNCRTFQDGLNEVFSRRWEQLEEPNHLEQLGDAALT